MVQNYGTSVVYDFPKTRLVDGPLQIEARIDQNAQLSGQLTLWNQQGSHVRRGTLLVIPVGKALLYAEPIYLQAERSPMPELRLVVLALQDKLVYGPNFDSAMKAMFGGEVSSLTAVSPPAIEVAPNPQPRPTNLLRISTLSSAVRLGIWLIISGSPQKVSSAKPARSWNSLSRNWIS